MTTSDKQESQLSTYEEVQIAIARALADSDRTPSFVVRIKGSIPLQRTRKHESATATAQKDLDTSHITATAQVVPEEVKAAVKKANNNAAAFTRKSFGGAYQIGGNNYRRIYDADHQLAQGVTPDMVMDDAHTFAAQTKADMIAKLTRGADNPQEGWNQVMTEFRAQNGGINAADEIPADWSEVERMIAVRVETKRVRKEPAATPKIMEALQETAILESLDAYGRMINQIEVAIGQIWSVVANPREKLSKTSFRKPIKDLTAALAFLPSPSRLAPEQLGELNAVLQVVFGVVGKTDETLRAVHGYSMTDKQWEAFKAEFEQNNGRPIKTQDGWIHAYQNLFAVPADQLGGIAFAQRAPTLVAEQARLDADSPEGTVISANFESTQAYMLEHPKIQALEMLFAAAQSLPRPAVG